MAAKQKVSEDVIARRYLQLKLNRDLRSGRFGALTKAYIVSLKTWLKGQPRRTRRPGGVGR